MYKQFRDPLGNLANGVVRLEDRATIPFDPANVDYQAYLKWVAESNQPEPAEETQ